MCCPTGFVETKRGCCGTGLIEFGPLCTPVTPTGEMASKYLFWDAAHPIELAYRYIAAILVKQVIPKLV
jgi:phospholipase/lecithinase/hemolysin